MASSKLVLSFILFVVILYIFLIVNQFIGTNTHNIVDSTSYTEINTNNVTLQQNDTAGNITEGLFIEILNDTFPSVNESYMINNNNRTGLPSLTFRLQQPTEQRIAKFKSWYFQMQHNATDPLHPR